MSNILLLKHHNSYSIPENPIRGNIAPFYGDPSISRLSNIMLGSITGNASIETSKIICMSDFHYDTSHKYIRAAMINEILHSRDAMPVLLLEGTQHEHFPNEWAYNKLVGNGQIYFKHVAYGWDDMQMNSFGISLIKKMQHLRSEIKELEQKYAILNTEKSKILKDSSISVEAIFEKVDSIEVEAQKLVEQAEKTNEQIAVILENINELSITRSDCLHKSIETAIQMFPESTIFVIGGADHFKFVPKYFSDTNHCILNLKEIREITNFDEAMQEVYGDISPNAVLAEEVD